jgi:hypothetical protein
VYGKGGLKKQQILRKSRIRGGNKKGLNKSPIGNTQMGDVRASLSIGRSANNE